MKRQTKKLEPYQAPEGFLMENLDYSVCTDSSYDGTVEGVVVDEFVWED